MYREFLTFAREKEKKRLHHGKREIHRKGVHPKEYKKVHCLRFCGTRRGAKGTNHKKVLEEKTRNPTACGEVGCEGRVQRIKRGSGGTQGKGGGGSR